MKRVLQILALAVGFAALSFWLTAGAQRGWSKTSTPVKSLDEVTGIEGITYKQGFVPGLDFVAAALLGAGSLVGASLFFRKSTSTSNRNTTTHS